MKLKSIEIERFRHIEDTEILFGGNLTAISGQNGTGKSSILGWIAQLCDYKGIHKRVNQDDFKENWSKVFRFCQENDFHEKYKVKFNYLTSKNNDDSTTLTTRYIATTQRYKCDFNRNLKGKTKRAIDFPVIYLGLRRLIPLSTESEKRIEQLDLDFTTSEANLYNKLAKKILLITDDKIGAEPIKSPNKKVLAMKTEKYGHLGNSAGQDNIGQILSAIISFQRLKEELKSDYKGGILLIDEIDSTLYAATQIKLIEVLNQYSEALNIQIVFTTHSIEILDFLSNQMKSNSFIGEKSSINFMNEVDKKVSNYKNPSANWVKLKIKGERGKQKKAKKINFICEDKNAEYWIKNLIRASDLNKLINPCGSNLPDTTLIEMTKSPNIIFKNLKYILDGDSRARFSSNKVLNNICFLPGKFGVEIIMYNFLFDLKESDEFWDQSKNLTKQTCFADHQHDGKQSTAKKWFNDKSIKEDFFGRGYSKLFNRWKKDNKDLVSTFHEDLRKIL
ncbi:MAG: AAA family ATPase [Bacteroidota bacterium]